MKTWHYIAIAAVALGGGAAWYFLVYRKSHAPKAPPPVHAVAPAVPPPVAAPPKLPAPKKSASFYDKYLKSIDITRPENAGVLDALNVATGGVAGTAASALRGINHVFGGLFK